MYPLGKPFKVNSQVVLMVAVSAVSAFPLPTVLVAHATATNMSLPDVQGCWSVGSTVAVALTASSVTSVKAWQVNVTFQKLMVVNQVVGSSWTGSSYFTANKTNSGSTLFSFAYLNNASFTSATPVTVLTITFKIMYCYFGTLLHIVLASEHSFGTVLLSPDFTSQTYTTTDGSFFNCVFALMTIISSSPQPTSSPA